MSGVFRQNSGKSSVYSDAAMVTLSHRPLPIIVSESVCLSLSRTHARARTHTEYVSYHFRVHAYIVLVQLNLPIMELQWTTIFFCCRQALFHTGA